MTTSIPIGRFSKMMYLSVKALRLYDEMRLFVPVHGDPSTGYRDFVVSCGSGLLTAIVGIIESRDRKIAPAGRIDSTSHDWICQLHGL